MIETNIRAELEEGKTVVFYTVGISMEPLLSERKTHVVVKSVPEGGVGINDIVLYERPGGQYVLHRLMKQKNGVYYIRGDNTYGYERVKPHQVFGVVEKIYKNGEYIDVATNKKYKSYVTWRRLNYPFRYFYLKLRGFIGRIIRFIKK